MSTLTRRTLVGVLAASALSACSTGPKSDDPTERPTAWTSTPPASASAPSVPVDATPARLEIGSIKLNEPIKGLGLSNNGYVEPPAGVVQWYNATPQPGSKGNSVIAGHVSFDGPDTFARLDEVKVGQKITVTRKDGKRLDFTVTRVESVEKNALRKRQDVWGKQSSEANLVLVTCDDTSRMRSGHYDDNFVVWAKPVRA